MKNPILKTKANYNKGITLVALIIAIIVLLILATVSINLVINNGILDKAKSAVDKYSDGEIEEQIKLAYQEYQMAQFTGTTESANDYIKSRLNSTIGNIEEVSVEDYAITVIITKNGENKTYYYNVKNGIVKQIELALNSNNKNDSYVGCYADIDEDGTVDGVIFVDLLTGSKEEKQFWGEYILPDSVTVNNVKKYYISKDNYTDSYLGSHPVISPKMTNGEKRFYIMSLTNFSSEEYIDNNNSSNSYPAYTKYSWYKKADQNMSNWESITSTGFGAGKANTNEMIERWNESTYGDKDNQDIWKHIKTKYNEGWFIPSKGEWAAFANELKMPNRTNFCWNSRTLLVFFTRKYSEILLCKFL